MKNNLGTVALVGALLGTTAQADMCDYHLNQYLVNAKKVMLYVDDANYTTACLYQKFLVNDVIQASAVCTGAKLEKTLKEALQLAKQNRDKLCN